MQRITIAMIMMVTMALLAADLTAQQHPANVYRVEKDNWYEWKDWSHDQKTFYVLGALSGAMAMAADIAYNSGYVDLLKLTEDRAPTDYQVREYVVAIDWIYEMKEYKKRPVCVIILDLKWYLERRREHERQQNR